MIAESLHQQRVEVARGIGNPLLLVLNRKPLQEVAKCGKAGARDRVVLRGDGESDGLENSWDGTLGDIFLFDIGLDAGKVIDSGVNRDIGVFEGRQEFRSLCLHVWHRQGKISTRVRRRS